MFQIVTEATRESLTWGEVAAVVIPVLTFGWAVLAFVLQSRQKRSEAALRREHDEADAIMLRKQELAEAELERLRQVLHERAVLDMSLEVVQEEGTPQSRYVVNVECVLTNRGSRPAHLLFPERMGLRTFEIRFDEEGRARRVREYFSVSEDVEGREFGGTAVVPGETQRLPFLVSVEKPGFYLLVFATELKQVDRHELIETADVDSTKPMSWIVSRYVQIRASVSRASRVLRVSDLSGE